VAVGTDRVPFEARARAAGREAAGVAPTVDDEGRIIYRPGR
jgi:hypothetical protein